MTVAGKGETRPDGQSVDVAVSSMAICPRSSSGDITVVDFGVWATENWFMSIDVAEATDPVERADSQAVLEHLLHGTPIDPDVQRRVHDRAATITKELRRKYGILDIAVELVRQVREE